MHPSRLYLNPRCLSDSKDRMKPTSEAINLTRITKARESLTREEGVGAREEEEAKEVRLLRTSKCLRSLKASGHAPIKDRTFASQPTSSVGALTLVGDRRA